MINIISLLPHVMTIGEDIVKCIEGDCTQEEWNKTVDDLYAMAISIPQVQGILVIMQIASYVSKVSFPLVDGFINGKTEADSKKMKAVRGKVAGTVTAKDIENAQRTVKFFDEVTAKIAKKNKMKLPKPDTSWTATFFEEVK